MATSKPSQLPKPSSPGMFSTFLLRPQGVMLAQQGKDEEVILLVRGQFANNAVWLAVTGMAIILPPLVPFFLRLLELHLFSLSAPLLIVLIIFFYLLVCGFALYNFVSWFYNIGIVTTQRVIDIDFVNLSYIDVAATTMNEVEDVLFTQKGFAASALDYGDVTVHTIAGREDFIFEGVPHPAQVVDVISKLLETHHD